MARNKIKGTKKDDDLPGTGSGDLILGKAGGDVLEGLAGSDVLKGAGGKDLLDGGKGADKLLGGGGDDTLVVSFGADKLDGGNGTDILDASAIESGIWLNVKATDTTFFGTPRVEIAAGTMLIADDGDPADWLLQEVKSIEGFVGGSGDDWITSFTETVWGTVKLGGGDDTFAGQIVTKVIGGAGDDDISIDVGKIVGGKGDDRLTATPTGFDTAKIFGGSGSDTLVVSAKVTAKGGAGDDRIEVLVGNTDQKVFGGAGADTFYFNSLGGDGAMQDFKPGVDKLDLSAYALTDPSITYEEILTWFEDGDGGTQIRLDSDRYSNQLFTFVGLSEGDISRDDIILM